MDQPLKILIVTTGKVLAPVSGGELRTRYLAGGLAGLGHTVDVVSFVTRNHAAGFARAGERLSLSQRHSVWLDLAALADRMRVVPITELPLWLAPLDPWLSGLVRREGYDIVQFDFPWFVSLYGATAPAAVVYNAQNIESDWWAPRLARYPFGDFFARRLREHEIRAAAGAAGVAACSPADLAWLKENARLSEGAARLVPNGFDGARFRRPTPEERLRLRDKYGFAPDEKIAVFCGSHTYPNQEAAEAILGRIAPECVAAGWQVVIVGRVGETISRDVQSGVTITGPVDDVLPYLQAADVAINPMQSGSGSNIKVAESCAAGLPLVTTAFGLRGFEGLETWVKICGIEEFPREIKKSSWPNGIPNAVIGEYSWQATAMKLAEFYTGLKIKKA